MTAAEGDLLADDIIEPFVSTVMAPGTETDIGMSTMFAELWVSCETVLSSLCSPVARFCLAGHGV